MNKTTKIVSLLVALVLVLFGIFYLLKFEQVKEPTTIHTNTGTIENYSNEERSIIFDYNSLFLVTPSTNTPSTDWKLGAKEIGVVLATVNIAKDFIPNTNFSDAKLTIGRSADMNAIRNCTAKQGEDGEGEMIGGRVTISGFPFVGFYANEAGAGNVYDTTSYRGIVDGDCYVVEYTIHSTNIGNYPAELGIKEFDKEKIKVELEKIVASLEFNMASD